MVWIPLVSCSGCPCPADTRLRWRLTCEVANFKVISSPTCLGVKRFLLNTKWLKVDGARGKLTALVWTGSRLGCSKFSFTHRGRESGWCWAVWGDPGPGLWPCPHYQPAGTQTGPVWNKKYWFQTWWELSCDIGIGGLRRKGNLVFFVLWITRGRIKWLVKSSDLHLYLPCCSDSVPQAIVHSGVIVFYLHPAAAQVERKLNRSRINKKFYGRR